MFHHPVGPCARSGSSPAKRLALGLSLLLVVGCWEETSEPVSDTVVQPFRGQQVELLVPKSMNLPAVWEVVVQEWSAQTGATVTFQEYSLDEPSALTGALERKAPGGGRLVVFPIRRMGDVDTRLASLEGVADAEFDSKDIFKGLYNRLLMRERALVAVPVSVPTLVCYYRRDLLKAAGKKPPETWSDYQSLIDSLESWAPGLTAVEPLAPSHRGLTLAARSMSVTKHPENYSLWFDVETGEPIVDTPGFVEAAEQAQKAWSRMPPEISNMTAHDCRMAVIEGRAALAIGEEPVVGAGSTDVATGSKKPNRPSGIEIGVCRLPGSKRVYNRNASRWEAPHGGGLNAPTLCGYDGFAVGIAGKTRDIKQAAVPKLLATLMGSQFELAFATLPKTVCRESQISSAAAWSDGAVTPEEASLAVDATAQALRDFQIVADFLIPGGDDFRGAVAACAERLLKAETNPAEAIKTLQADFAEITHRTGSTNVRAAYRRAVGLTGPPPDLKAEFNPKAE